MDESLSATQESTGRVTTRYCSDAEEWDTFVATIPWATPQHTFAWGAAVASSFGYAHIVHRLFSIDGQTVAALPLMRFSAGGPFRGVYSLIFDSYGGPLISPDYLEDRELLSRISIAIDAEAAKHKAFEARIMVPPLASETVVRCLQLKQETELLKRACPIVHLNRPLQEIQDQYASSVRRAIRRSRRDGVVIEESADLDLVRRAFPIYQATMKRIGGTVKPWRFLESLFRDKLAVAFVALLDGRPIGLVILLVSPGMAMYWISAADDAASVSRPTNALVDTAVRWCHEQGISHFSFGESPGERPGLVRFKKGWHPTEYYSTAVLRVYRPWIHRMWVVLQPIARRAYAVLDKFVRSG
jgi:CelD/BcsL family acetyltransferase involved in cellulose biosynthesis